MSGWSYHAETTNGSTWFWVNCTKALSNNDEQFEQWFEVQQYVGPIQRLYVYPGNNLITFFLPDN